MRKIIIFIIALVCLLTLLATSFYNSSSEINWHAIGPGSAKLSSGSVELQGMLGQGIIGEVNQAESELCSGYLCIFEAMADWIYLPLIVK